MPTGVKPYWDSPNCSNPPRLTMVMARPLARSSVLVRNEACGAPSKIFTVWSLTFTTSVTLERTREWIEICGSLDRL